jgi:hypothetical protein
MSIYDDDSVTERELRKQQLRKDASLMAEMAQEDFIKTMGVERATAHSQGLIDALKEAGFSDQQIAEMAQPQNLAANRETILKADYSGGKKAGRKLAMKFKRAGRAPAPAPQRGYRPAPRATGDIAEFKQRVNSGKSLSQEDELAALNLILGR